MSVAAVMLVKDEVDVIATTVTHVLRQVDFLIVADNLSSDGTGEELLRIRDHGVGRGRMLVQSDDEVAYRQDAKTTRLASLAIEMGHEWVVPVDADEIWYSPFGRLGTVLEALPESFLFAKGTILNHVVTDADFPDEPDPVERLRWRIGAPGELPKVACRALPDLLIEMGNHGATARGRVHSSSHPSIDGQIYIHHYPWRTPEQFLRKITNGALAYAAAPEMGEDVGAHWRRFGMPGDAGFEERVRAWFDEWAVRRGIPPEPLEGEELAYDPARIERGTW